VCGNTPKGNALGRAWTSAWGHAERGERGARWGLGGGGGAAAAERHLAPPFSSSLLLASCLPLPLSITLCDHPLIISCKASRFAASVLPLPLPPSPPMEIRVARSLGQLDALSSPTPPPRPPRGSSFPKPPTVSASNQFWTARSRHENASLRHRQIAQYPLRARRQEGPGGGGGGGGAHQPPPGRE
jgi:hypothetical protein